VIEMRTRFVTGCLVALIAGSDVMAADCVRDSYGNTVCGKGQCVTDQYGKVLCAKDGGLQKNVQFVASHALIKSVSR
jgi:hypothetical protein